MNEDPMFINIDDLHAILSEYQIKRKDTDPASEDKVNIDPIDIESLDDNSKVIMLALAEHLNKNNKSINNLLGDYIIIKDTEKGPEEVIKSDLFFKVMHELEIICRKCLTCCPDRLDSGAVFISFLKLKKFWIKLSGKTLNRYTMQALK